MVEVGEGPWENGDLGGKEESTEGSTRPWRWHGDQDSGSGRVWVVMAQEDGAVWEDRVSSWGQKWKQWGMEKCSGVDGALEMGVEADGAVKGSAGQHGEVGECRPT